MERNVFLKCAASLVVITNGRLDTAGVEQFISMRYDQVLSN